jgi:FkbM family methyltransferase
MSRPPRSNSVKAKFKRLLKRFDLNIGRHRHTLAGAREDLLRNGGVELVVDVGAHAGEYGQALRASGYGGSIVSFEPIRSLFERLVAASSGDDAWKCHNRGAGSHSGTATINVSANDGFSSSLLTMNEAHERAVRESHYGGSEAIELVTIDEALADRKPASRSVYLKVDAQGYEHEVLAGAIGTLRCCRGVELELSLTTLYEGQLLIGETIELMRQHGFHPTQLEPEFVDPQSGELLQVNGLFQPISDSVAGVER